MKLNVGYYFLTALVKHKGRNGGNEFAPIIQAFDLSKKI